MHHVVEMMMGAMYLENGDDHIFPAQVRMPSALILPVLASFKSQEVPVLGC